MNTWVISGQLTTRTALHVGSGRSSAAADALLRRTGAGELFVPGSAVAGSLRALATRLAPRLGGGVCKALQGQEELEQRNAAERDSRGRPTACQCAACHLFGAVDPQEQNEAEQGGRAARLWIHDATLTGQPPTTVRDAVGIDRRTGAAARLEAVKFDLEALPAGVIFELRLELEDTSAMDQQLLAATLAEWQAGRGNLGGRVARGLGAFVLTDLACHTRDLNQAAALMAFLRSDAPSVGLPADPQWLPTQLTAARQALGSSPPNPHVARSWLELELTLQATGPFLANDATMARRAGFDHAPLVEGRPVLPGASLRGVLRSQAERIARTLATVTAVDAADFLRRCPACSPVARRKDEAKSVPLECCDALLTIPTDEEVGEEDLCLACRLFGSARLGSRLLVEDAPLQKDTAPQYKVQDFLAIDRFTGGGRDSAKFDAVALWRPAFTARLRLDNPRAWELGWLALVLRDLAEGWLTVGFGRAKGFGQVTTPAWMARIGFLQPADFPAASADAATQASSVPLPAQTDPATLLAAAPRELSQEKPSLYRVFELSGAVSIPPADRPHDRPTWQLANGADGQAWLNQVNAWIAAFGQQIKDFNRQDGALPALPADTYFGQMASGAQPMTALYPKPHAALEALHHA